MAAVECLDANAVQDLMSGALDSQARAETAAHLDTCEDCRGLVSVLAKDAARAPVDKLGFQDTEHALREAETVKSRAQSSPGRPDPLGVTAADSLIQKSGRRQVGKTFGKYTLVDRIGAGAMGVVYRAEDPQLNRKVALKLLHKPDEDLAKRLVREAQSMAQVNHPNVVHVWDAGTSDNTTYIAMELVTGSSLRAWQQEKHTVPEIIEAYAAAGRGLAAAHDAGIIHRDFKPDNCLIGKDGRVRVTDFGLASARPSDDGTTPEELELSSSGMVLGTPAYMSPEQFTGGNVDPRTDQFNYCVALYEALYGERPFKGKTFDELGDNVCDGKVRPPPPKTRVSSALRAIVLRGLAVRPGDRYPTMDHLLDDLGRDRARGWRLTAIVAVVLAALLSIGLAADFVIRDRVSIVNAKSFNNTGTQVARAIHLIAERFDANARQMDLHRAVHELRSYNDVVDFGLGTEDDDRQNLESVHAQLASSDWKQWAIASSRGGTDKSSTKVSTIAFGDYKERLMFTNAPGARPWRVDKLPSLASIPWIQNTYDEPNSKAMVLQPTNDPSFVKSGILGDHPRYPLAFCFARSLSTEGATISLIQSVDARLLLDDIKLDDTLLSVVSLEDRARVGEVPDPLIAAANVDRVADVEYDGKLYQVKRQELTDEGADHNGEPIGYVVMAQEVSGVLSGLFPHARLIFALAALAALGTAIGTTLKARQLAR